MPKYIIEREIPGAGKLVVSALLRERERIRARCCPWTNQRFRRLGTAAALLFWIQACVLGDDIVTQSGRVLKNAGIVSFEGDRVTIKHEGGVERFDASEIPEPLCKRFRDEDLKRKRDEIEKLKQELARRESELKQLSDDNERPARGPKQVAPNLSPDGAVPSPLPATLPAVRADDVVEAGDLVLQYRANIAAADRRVTKKTFRIRGVIERFEPRMFMRRYDVLLESPDKSVSVVCKFAYADKWNAVYTKERGRELVAKEGKSEIRLLNIGDTVTIRARCEGLKGSEIEFSRCERVR